MFDHGRSLTLRGTVTKFQWTNPHGYIELDVTDRVCEDNRKAADEQGRRKIKAKVSSERNSMPASQQPSRSPRAESRGNDSGSWRGNYAEWIAVGALIAGSVGALYGAKHSSRRSQRTDNDDRPESTKLTAPHGDKLEAALR